MEKLKVKGTITIKYNFDNLIVPTYYNDNDIKESVIQEVETGLTGLIDVDYNNIVEIVAVDYSPKEDIEEVYEDE